jgi:hypothetical protein
MRLFGHAFIRAEAGPPSPSSPALPALRARSAGAQGAQQTLAFDYYLR